MHPEWYPLRTTWSSSESRRRAGPTRKRSARSNRGSPIHRYRYRGPAALRILKAFSFLGAKRRCLGLPHGGAGGGQTALLLLGELEDVAHQQFCVILRILRESRRRRTV